MVEFFDDFVENINAYVIMAVWAEIALEDLGMFLSSCWPSFCLVKFACDAKA